MKRIKNKKTLAIAGVVAVALGVGATIAYNMDALNFDNLFHVGGSIEEYTDIFESPSNWQPCEEISKTVTATNKNTTNRYVRMKIDEYWRTADTQTPATDHTTSDLSLTWNDNGTTKSYAVINMQNTSYWTDGGDGWWYYNDPIGENETTLSLLQSVTLNCDANLVTNGTASATQGGQSGSSTPTAYAGATYHAYVTVQMSDTSWTPEPYTADCDNPNNDLLYDKIACATNGTDENLDYNSDAISVANGLGVNTYAPSVNDQYKTYYYRGAVQDNYVVWDNKCWRIVRTTEKGGVKMIYADTASNGTCQTDTYDMTIGSSTLFNPYNYGFAHFGYMYGNTGYPTLANETPVTIGNSTSYYFSNDVTWDGTQYTLTDTDVYGTISQHSGAAFDDHHYICLNGSTTCTSVAYLYEFYMNDNTETTDWGAYVTFSDGITIETFGDDVFANTNSSAAKTLIDNWYNTNITANKRGDLEDTVFCADRSMSGSFRGKDYAAPIVDEMYEAVTSVIFGARMRLWTGDYTLACSKRDSLTVQSTATTSGALTYPIGLLSVDEARMTGMYYEDHTYLKNASWSTSISPVGFDRDWMAIGMLDGSYNGGEGPYLPVVALKFGAKFTGAGTASDPYQISF